MTLLALAGVLWGLSGCGSGTTHSTGASSAAGTTISHPPRPELAFNPLFSRTFPAAPAAEQTQPAVSPASGSTTTVFTLALTARQSLGAQKGVRYAYLVLLRGPHPRCSVYTQLTIGRRGARLPLALRPPIELGWCRGTFSGQVLLQASPNCVATPGATSTHCTVFAPRLSQAGRFRFRTQ